MPECERAMTMSAPASLISGTQALAASTMSRVITLPSRFFASQIMICGGTKPMMPILIGCSLPSPSFNVWSRMTYGFRNSLSSRGLAASVVPLTRLAQTNGNFAPAMHLLHEVEAVVELVVAERRALIAEHVHPLHDRVEVAGLHAAAHRRCSRPSGCPAGGRHCRSASSWSLRRGSPRSGSRFRDRPIVSFGLSA